MRNLPQPREGSTRVAGIAQWELLHPEGGVSCQMYVASARGGDAR